MTLEIARRKLIAASEGTAPETGCKPASDTLRPLGTSASHTVQGRTQAGTALLS